VLEYSSVDIFLVDEDGYIKELTEPVVEGSLLSITFSDELSLMSCRCEFEVQKSGSYGLED
jgi:hypothetical protein